MTTALQQNVKSSVSGGSGLSRSKDLLSEISSNSRFDKRDTLEQRNLVPHDQQESQGNLKVKKKGPGAQSTQIESSLTNIAQRSISPLGRGEVFLNSKVPFQEKQDYQLQKDRISTQSPTPQKEAYNQDDEPLQKQNTANFGQFMQDSSSPKDGTDNNNNDDNNNGVEEIEQFLMENNDSKDEGEVTASRKGAERDQKKRKSPRKVNSQTVQPDVANNRIIKERLGIENFGQLDELVIQLQGYNGAAAANVGNSEQKSMLIFKDLYKNPEIIGQGAFGVVVRVEKIIVQSRTLPQKQFQTQTPTYQLREQQNYNNSIDTDSSSPITPLQRNPQNKQYAPQIVAVKVINKKELNDSGYQVLKNEALILKEMDHPNIVKFFDIYETNEFIFIEMEYIPNGTLRNMMQKGKKTFTDYEVSQIIGGLLNAVHHVHSKNYVHRDLKPENVLIGDPDAAFKDSEIQQQEVDSPLRRSIKLADFGLSASFRISEAHSLDERMGTLLFMAPEQTKNQNYGKKIDIWAMGIIMYQLLQGSHPLYISGVDNNQTYLEKLSRCNPAKWIAENSPSSSNFTQLARDLFLKLCNPMPIERYTAEQALRHPWITRNFESPIPQTESQKVREVQAETLLRGAVNITFFLSVARLRRNIRSFDQKNSQQSTSSSSCSLDKSSLGINIPEYMAKCERVIAESEERERQRIDALRQMKDPNNTNEISEDSSPAIKASDLDLIENFDEIRASATPNMKPSKNQDQLIFEFNTQNVKKADGDTSQAVLNKKSSVNTSTIKKIPTLNKKGNSSMQQQQPQQFKKAQIHYQQLFTDDTDKKDGNLPGCLVQERQSQMKQPFKKPQSTLQEELVKQSQSVSPSSKRIGNTFHTSNDDQRNKNLIRQASSQSEAELKIDDESLKSIAEIEKQKPKPGGFQLNLKKLERQQDLDDDIDVDLVNGPQQNRTPNEFDVVRTTGEYSGMSAQSQILYQKQPQKLKTSKIQSSKNKQNDLGALLQPEFGSVGIYSQGIERQSLTDLIARISPEQKSKLEQNPQSLSQQHSLKKKRTLVAASSQMKPKKITEFDVINENIKLYEIEGLNELAQKIPITSFGQNGPTMTQLFDEIKQLQPQLKSVLQSKSKTGISNEPSVGFQLPMIGKNDDATNRRLGPIHQVYDNSTVLTKSKNTKGQRSLENTGQRTHNYFFNYQHSLQASNQKAIMEGIDPTSLQDLNHHSFIGQPILSLVDARRQSGNYSFIDNQHQHINQQQLDTFFNILPGGILREGNDQAILHKQMTSAEFYQFHQKYQQWKDQRGSMLVGKQGSLPNQQQPLAVELQKHMSGTAKQNSQKGAQLYQHPGQHRPSSKESDEMLLMAAKGNATLKYQKSTSNVMSIQPSGGVPASSTEFELPPTKQIYQTTFQNTNAANQFSSETKAQRARGEIDHELSNFKKTQNQGKIQYQDGFQIRLEDQLKLVIQNQVMNRGKSYNNKMMPQHLGGQSIIKNGSVMVTSLSNANAVRHSELGINQTKTKRAQNDLSSSSQVQIVGMNQDNFNIDEGIPLQSKNQIIAQKIQSVQNNIIQKAKKSR